MAIQEFFFIHGDRCVISQNFTFLHSLKEKAMFNMLLAESVLTKFVLVDPIRV